MKGDRVDFFVSHAGADRAWAEWVAWQLTGAGYAVELDVWDWAAGQNFITAMSAALDRCDRILALFSAAYFDRDRYTTEEWSVSVLHVPGALQGRLVPVRVENVPSTQTPAVLRPLVYRDIFGLAEEQARRVLLEAVSGPRRPDRKPAFPGRVAVGALSELTGSGPRLPGSVPRVWNIPARNPGFSGRDGVLVTMRERLLAGDRAVIQALHGMGGVGKTQLAVEYAHRFAGTYDLAWWVTSEQPGLIGDQFAALAAELGCAEAGAGLEAVRSAVLGELRELGGWLLVFDNAENPAALTRWLPGGGGHVLITSRKKGWTEIAVPVEIDVFARTESVAMLCNRMDGLIEADADQLAAQLGDLPLAIAQAAGFMTETGMPAAQYLDLLQTQAGQLLDQGSPESYPRSLAATAQLLADRLGQSDPVAAQLADLCSFLAPEPIPETLFTSAATELPGELAARSADPMAWRQTLARLTQHSLARIDQRGIQLHRLTQAILRDRLSAARFAATRECCEAVLAASDPRSPDDPATWQKWAQLMPHLLAADLAATDNSDLRQMACNACLYLLRRGDTHTAYGLASDLIRHWRARLGEDHGHTLVLAYCFAWALRNMACYTEARDLDQDTLDRRRRVLGEDHPHTLSSASNLALDLRELGEVQAARDLDQDTLDRRRQVLGEDHPDTLGSANNLACDLRDLGDFQAARDLDQDTLDRHCRVLGEDHPHALSSASNLALDLRKLGEVQAARDLDQDTLDRRRRVLGEDHPYTLGSASNLALDLRELGEVQAARDLDQDTLDRRRRVLGEDHPYTLGSASNLAYDLRELGEVQAARDLDQDTLDRRRRVLGEDHPHTLSSANELVGILRDLGEIEAARDLAQDTLDRSRRTLGYDHPRTRQFADEYSLSSALLHLRRGESEMAAAIYETIVDESLNDSHAQNNYGFCLLPNNPEAALDCLTKASKAPNHHELITLANSVLAFHLLGRDAEALLLGSPDAALALPEARARMWLVSHDHRLELSGLVDVHDYLEELMRHIETVVVLLPQIRHLIPLRPPSFEHRLVDDP